MHRYLILIFSFGLSYSIAAQDVFGKWKTIDDKTGEAKSIISIYEKNDKVFGSIIDILDPSKKEALCFNCEGEKYNKPVMGMVIIEGLKKDDDVYSGGKILDPENGKIYTSKIWVDKEHPDVLNVRGYIAFFYRTQQWIRVE